MIKTEKVIWNDTDFEGNKFSTFVTYQIYFDTEGNIVDIRNEFNTSVVKNSMCWDFITLNYK